MVSVYHTITEDIIDCKPGEPMIWQQFPGFGIRAPIDLQLAQKWHDPSFYNQCTNIGKGSVQNMATILQKYSQKMLIVMLMIPSDVTRYA